MFRRWWCVLRGGHHFITAQIHWWEWGGSRLWHTVAPTDPEFNAIACRRCGWVDWVQIGCADEFHTGRSGR